MQPYWNHTIYWSTQPDLLVMSYVNNIGYYAGEIDLPPPSSATHTPISHARETFIEKVSLDPANPEQKDYVFAGCVDHDIAIIVRRDELDHWQWVNHRFTPLSSERPR